ncbi:hypothetical protein C8J57DRAFT_1508444 [Mycena rebaudengoi]|nr:hypothetical protein C8J57DRAFT_1508444 [Mycena rebaudengoi]
MASTTDKMFYGDGRPGDWNPRDFLKKIKRGFFARANATDADKVQLFELSLASGAAAEAWFDGLSAADRVTWAALEAAFDTRWPKDPPEMKTTQELSDEMVALELREDEMGKKIMVDGIEMYGHIRWAKQMVALSAKDTIGHMIPQVRRGFPKAMRNLVANNHTTWASFLTAVRTVSVADLLEEIENEERLRTHDRAALQMSPTAPLRNAFARASLGASPSPARPFLSPPTLRAVAAPVNAAANPSASNGPMHPNNLFSQARRPFAPAAPATPMVRRPEPERLVDLQRNLLTHHPDTPAGRTAHAQQVVTWKTRHGDRSQPNEYRPYPLTPGTAALDSGECFHCARVGHMAKNQEGILTCPNPAIPELESRWRNIAAFIFRNSRRIAEAASLAAADMRYISTIQAPETPPIYDPVSGQYYVLDYGNYDDDAYTQEEQGKGQGSST